MTNKVPAWVWASLVGTFLVSSFSLIYRYRAEASNRGVGIMIEDQVAHDLGAASGKPQPEILRELKAHGVTGVAVSEDTLGDLMDRGQIKATVYDKGLVGLSGPSTVLNRIATAVSHRDGMGLQPPQMVLGDLTFKGDPTTLRTLPVGLDPDECGRVLDAGLVLIARHSNIVGAGPTYVRETLQEDRDKGASAFLPSGEQVLGQRESIDDTRLALTDLGMDYLTAEFAKLGGDSRVSAAMPEHTIRLHSMQQAEIDRASEGAILERYTKAYRERNVRWLLVRPLSLGGQDVLASFDSFLFKLRQAVVREKGSIKPPKPYKDPGAPRLLFPLIGLLSAPWIYWTGTLFVSHRGWRLSGLALCVLLGAAAWLEPARPYTALFIGVVSPVTAFMAWFARRDASHPVWLDFLWITALSFVGGLAVAGLLNSLPYMIEVKQAVGIKAILLVPLLLVGWKLLTDVAKPSDLAQQPMRWGPALGALAVLAAVAFLWIRSGNDAPTAVSETELKFRALLDRLLYTRPRTKEILVGHPALLVGLLLARQARSDDRLKGFAALALALGVIGQSDIVDTMCHIHTPLDVGVARIVIGLVIGGIMGLLLWWPVRTFILRNRTS